MSTLTDRINKLSEEVENFPLGKASLSDDTNIRTLYLISFKDLAKRFGASLRRLDDSRLLKMLKPINFDPEHITEAHDLKADLQGVIDYLKDNNNLRELVSITAKESNDLSKIIIENLSQESANNLPMICTGYGLEAGTTEEAFKSKRNYVYKRISPLDNLQIFDLGKKMVGKYPDSQLDALIAKLFDSDFLGLISKFDDIQSAIINEITNAKYIIWIAVAWFTDKDLANLLFKKAKQGVNVQIILNDDKINSTLKEKLEKHFEVYFARSDDKIKRLMHNKFCVIDLEKVIHGSYNWTNKAQYNNETITIVDNRFEAKVFAGQFLKLKTEKFLKEI